jgi:hypothetical protein
LRRMPMQPRTEDHLSAAQGQRRLPLGLIMAAVLILAVLLDDKKMLSDRGSAGKKSGYSWVIR